MSVVRYGIGLGFPDPAIDVVPTGHGYNFFAGGPWSFVSAVQTVTVSSISTAIDAGEVDYALAADLGGFQAYNDSPVVSYQFLNDANGTIGFAIMLGPATPSDRGSVTGFSHFSQAGTVPTGTRAIRITMSMTRGGSFNNGYVDNVELVLADPLRYVYLPLTLK